MDNFFQILVCDRGIDRKTKKSWNVVLPIFYFNVDIEKNGVPEKRLDEALNLQTHFQPMFHFYTPWFFQGI